MFVYDSQFINQWIIVNESMVANAFKKTLWINWMYLKVNINHMVNECIIFTILSTNIHAPSTLGNLQRVVIYHSGVNIGRNIWDDFKSSNLIQYDSRIVLQWHVIWHHIYQKEIIQTTQWGLSGLMGIITDFKLTIFHLCLHSTLIKT